MKQRLVEWLKRLASSRSVGSADGVADEHIRLLAENVSDVISRLGSDLQINYVTPSCTAVYGWTPEEIIGRPALDFIVPEDWPLVEAATARLVAGEVDQITVTLRSPCKNGRIIWTESTAKRIRNPESGALEHVLIARDVTERKQFQDALVAMAMKDGLTGLANRRAFDQAMDRMWSETLSSGGQMSLLLLDVDHFKLFNDQYGHQVGDDCLRAVAAAIAGAVRPGDVAARYGGEEMAIILPDTNGTAAKAMGEQIREAIVALNMPHAARPDGDHVTISIGAATAIARAGGTIRMPEGLLSAADTALYKAKHHGRNRVETSLLVAPASDAVTG